MRRFLAIFLLLAGLTGVGIWVWSTVRLKLSQKNANQVLETKLGKRPVPAPAVRHISNGDLVGRLKIPRLNLAAAVREGAGEDTLDVALGHIPGTAMPGQPGNVGVAGHRDTLFRGLRKIEKDDVIQFQTPAGSYNYQVENTRIVTPKDVDVLRAGQQSEMTLVTCYPFYYVGPAPKRFIVKARLMAPQVEAAPTVVASAPTVVASPPKVPAPTAAVATRPAAARPAKPAVRRVNFSVGEHQTSQLAPGVLLNLSWTDPVRNRANGWVRISAEGRTIWLHNLAVHQPILFHRRELMITRVTRDSMSGYLLLFN